jgi:hypothetical protein
MTTSTSAVASGDDAAAVSVSVHDLEEEHANVEVTPEGCPTSETPKFAGLAVESCKERSTDDPAVSVTPRGEIAPFTRRVAAETPAPEWTEATNGMSAKVIAAASPDTARRRRLRTPTAITVECSGKNSLPVISVSSIHRELLTTESLPIEP